MVVCLCVEENSGGFSRTEEFCNREVALKITYRFKTLMKHH